jgi:hypothetical protein
MYSICTSYATSLSRHVPSVGATAAWQRKWLNFGSLYEIEGFGFKPSPGALAGRCQFGDRSEVAGQRPARERQLSVHPGSLRELSERPNYPDSGPSSKSPRFFLLKFRFTPETHRSLVAYERKPCRRNGRSRHTARSSKNCHERTHIAKIENPQKRGMKF